MNTDLERFNTIRPCGHDSQVMTSVNSIKRKEYSKEVIQTKIIKNFSDVFEAGAGHRRAAGDAPRADPAGLPLFQGGSGAGSLHPESGGGPALAR